MAQQALYLKWRPRRWEEVVGQQHVVQTLRNAIAAGRIAHAYLFAGPRGTGKTTTARLLAKAVNCLDEDLARRPCDSCAHCQAVNEGRFLDLIEIDAASNTSVEDVRALREKINFAPNQGRYKVYIIDEVHMLSTAAFNALLKTLEEPPAHAIFVLATTEIHKIPATVLSRCQRHEFRRIPHQEMRTYLRHMVEEEGFEVSEEALALVARQSTGCLRDAISLLDQLTSAGHAVDLAAAQAVLGTASSQAVVQVVDALLANEASAALQALHDALDAGSDPRQLARQVVEYLRNLLLIQWGNADMVDVASDMRSHMARQATAFQRPLLLGVIRAFNQAASEARASWQPALPLELALLEAINVLHAEAPGTAAPAASTRPPQAQAPARNATPPGAATPPRQTASPQRQSVPSHPPEETSSLLGEVVSRWRQVVKQALKIESPVANQASGMLNSGQPLQIKGSVLVIGYPSELLRKRMDDPEYRQVAERALQQVFGKTLRVECVVSAATRKELPPGVDSEGMVATAVRDLGGEVVDMQ